MLIIENLKLINKKAILKDDRQGIIKSTLNKFTNKGIEVIGFEVEGIGEVDKKDVKEIL